MYRRGFVFIFRPVTPVSQEKKHKAYTPRKKEHAISEGATTLGGLDKLEIFPFSREKNV